MSFTLLVADDSLTVQRVIELTFADEDVHVVAVGDGDQAIARLEAEPPDIVLADVDMPGKNGYEVARHIKQSPRLAHIPVVLLTGALEPIGQASDSGCDGILAKPFEPQLAIATVRELLKRLGGAPRALDEDLDAPPRTPASATSDDHQDVDRVDAAVAQAATRHVPAAAAQETVDRPTPDAARGMPSLADAFAALLAAEQRGTDPAAASIWPAAPGPAALVTDDLIEEIVRRVLARLPDRVVRETVADVVSTLAERLIRDEIERIKDAIR